MPLPFTVEQFFEVFARYNAAVWPAQWGLTILAISSIALATRGNEAAARLISGIIAVFWLWMGTAYHFAFFTSINPAAWLFGTAFIVAGGLFAWTGAWKGRLTFEVRGGVTGIVGALIVAYALVGYPLAGYLAGHRYPAVPTFGAPCPTTLFTLGILLWVRGAVPWHLAAIPILWALVGTSAAISLGVVQDYGLGLAGATTLVLLLSRRGGRQNLAPAAGPPAPRGETVEHVQR